MGVVTAAQALGRPHYRLARIPFDLFEDTVMPVLFDNGAPARLAYQWVLIECDNAAAVLLDDAAAVLLDDAAAATHAQRLRQRSTAVGYALPVGNGRASMRPTPPPSIGLPDLPGDCPPGRIPQRWVMVEVEEAYIHCRKHIPAWSPFRTTGAGEPTTRNARAVTTSTRKTPSDTTERRRPHRPNRLRRCRRGVSDMGAKHLLLGRQRITPFTCWRGSVTTDSRPLVQSSGFGATTKS
ncbi:hypothetical protein ACFTWF_24110 [Rhodococcus sp. NPDC056960]|uniref:hypothetical protein n=1 Tax=Rhodococcus sp. NPDC056960 TaxID=3345982 RepID=UPI00362F520A